jgi:hypothetical protein
LKIIFAENLVEHDNAAIRRERAPVRLAPL